MKLSTITIDGVKYVRARAIESEVKSIRKGLQEAKTDCLERRAKGAKIIADALNRLEEAVTEKKS